MGVGSYKSLDHIWSKFCLISIWQLNNTKSEEKRIQQNDCLKEEAFVICPCSGEKNSETSKNYPKIFQILVHSKSISLAIRDT